MRALMTIFREVRDPRDLNARHDCASMLFVALMATLCGAEGSRDKRGVGWGKGPKLGASPHPERP